MNALKQYIDLYDSHADVIAAHAPQALNDLRPAAYAALRDARLPRKGEEDYEGTDLESFFAPDYGVNINRQDFDANPADIFNCDVPNLSSCLYFFGNDMFHPSRTARLHDDAGVVVESLAEAAVNHPDLLARYYGKLANMAEPAVALNTLLAQDGLLIYVPDGAMPERTIQVVNIFNASAPLLASRRVLIVAGRDARVRVLMCDHTQVSGVQYLSNQVVEIFAQPGSSVDYYDMEESSDDTRRVSSLYVEQQQGSNVLVDGITLLNGFTRNNYRVEVNGEHCETRLLGMTIASGRQHVDSHTYISHNAPRCTSNEMFKYVLNEEAVGAFEGKIYVKEGCPRVEAYQGNRNICGSPTARMYTKPQLEIYTDDVVCSHGATVGQIDEEALFYMRTRGIPQQEARKLLMQAFVADVIDGVRLDTLRDRLRYLVEKRFAGTLASCGACGAACAPRPNNKLS